LRKRIVTWPLSPDIQVSRSGRAFPTDRSNGSQKPYLKNQDTG
jgi:hypothetical protein